MKKLILILLLMLIGFMLVGKSVTSTAPLPELINSHSLAADESQIYIAESGDFMLPRSSDSIS